MSPLPALICEYLDGEDGSQEVLNDALEESGCGRWATSGPVVARLQVLLNRVLPDRLAHRLALDFAEHVSAACDSEIARNLLEEKRRWLADQPESRCILYQDLAGLHVLGWEDDNSSKSSAIWALWSALIVPPSYVAAAAQRVRGDELVWQVEHVKKIVMSHL